MTTMLQDKKKTRVTWVWSAVSMTTLLKDENTSDRCVVGGGSAVYMTTLLKDENRRLTCGSAVSMTTLLKDENPSDVLVGVGLPSP